MLAQVVAMRSEYLRRQQALHPHHKTREYRHPIFIEASDAAGPAQFIAADTEDEAVTDKDQKK